MKTLDQWLEDTDEEDDEGDVQRDSSENGARVSSDGYRSSTSRMANGFRISGATSFTDSHVSAHTPTTVRPAEHPAGGLYARQEETREKMRRLLGADVVVKATTPTVSSVGSGSPVWPISAPPDRTHFPFGAPPNSGQLATQELWIPPALGNAGSSPVQANATSGAGNARTSPNCGQAHARADTATDSSHLPEVEQTMKGLSSGGGPAYEAVEVMVVDRGTQTVTSEGTQTEPGPISVGPFYTGPCVPPVYSGYGGMGDAYGNYLMPPHPSFGFGVDSRSYRQHLYDYEKKEAEEASKLREELATIQSSIDMLIARYNLPPPPL
ncbi:hypothetical protein ABL78_7414 [Leptomonas seymouri]|uniref:Uncharacterized protein n=1 Tax=Leptomonas seymouri TaxID=5684 RepID=A0A0N0P3E0_LEPSE|nr:hypothetical protein ABL78_7414 [Leptomonas seymouri]|eukprot:KPI83557.1 hypothetical protein ABL78_7414 [Leptomonas seymouri]